MVNNAGIWYVSQLDVLPEKLLHRMMDVNFYGMVRTTQTFLPLVKQAKGRIVNVCSVGGNRNKQSSFCVRSVLYMARLLPEVKEAYIKKNNTLVQF